jgi:hypothetical protein
MCRLRNRNSAPGPLLDPVAQTIYLDEIQSVLTRENHPGAGNPSAFATNPN